MSRKEQKKTAKAQSQAFIKRTISIPDEISDFANQQTARPEHAGNFSSYVRSLIIRDRQEAEKLKPAA